MKFDELYEATIKQLDDGCCAENIAYNIAYKVKPVRMPLIKADSPSKEAHGWWNYQNENGDERSATMSVKKYRNNLCVGCYISDKGSNREFDEANEFPHTFKKWNFKISSKDKVLDEISKYISKAIRADMKGKTIKEK
jgi:hypothetical protein